jgi:hypothetical protein
VAGNSYSTEKPGIAPLAPSPSFNGNATKRGNSGGYTNVPSSPTPPAETQPREDNGNNQPSPTPRAQLKFQEQVGSPSPPAASLTSLPSSFTYRARLSQKDHFNSAGRDLRQVPNIKVNDILLQDRVNFYRFHLGGPEDQPDPYYSKMNFSAYRALFEDKPLTVSPAGGENLIFNGTPLVEVTIGQGSVSVHILDDPPSASSSHSATPIPVPGQVAPTPTPRAPNILPTPEQIFRIPELYGLIGKHLYNAGLYGDFTIIDWHTDRAVLRSRFGKLLSGDTWVNVTFDESAENLRTGKNITFPRQSPLRILDVEKKPGGGILVTARY